MATSVVTVPTTEREMALSGCRDAHRALLASLDGLTDDQATAPSLLAGWTVGHVLTHIARNADSFVWMTTAAQRGVAVPQYPGGMEQRNGDIEAGAARPAAQLVDDVRTASSALDACWADVAPEVWSFVGQSVLGAAAIGELPMRRWREVAVHHGDLGLGVTPADWPAAYVRLDLAEMTRRWASRRPMGLTDLPTAALALPPHERLAWLLGRRAVAGLDPAGVM